MRSHRPERGELAHGVQAEHLLNARQRRKFFGGNGAQLGIGKAPIQRVDHVAPPRLEQGQGVQCQRVEEATAGVGLPGFQIGDYPNRVALAGR